MKKFTTYIAGVLTGLLMVSVPIFADSYTKAIDALVNFTTIEVNGNKVQSDNFVVDGKTYVWIRDVANMLNKDITWDESTNTANIVEKGSVPPASKEIAKVNNIVITDRKLNSFMKSDPSQTKDAMFQTLVDSAIELSKANEMGIVAQPSDVEDVKTKLEQSKQAYGEDSFKSYLDKIDSTEAEYIDIMVDQSIQNKLYDKIKGETNFDDATLKKTYDDNLDSFITVTAKHILIKTIDANGNPLSDDKKKEAKAKADKLYEQLKKGADFDKLMSENSEDTSSKDSKEGFTFGKGQMVPEFEKAAFSQDINKIYEPVESQFGYHIILVTDKKVPTFEEQKEDCKNIAFSDYYKNMLAEWKKNANIQINQDTYNSININ